jgi:hypothetical protein
MDTEHPAQQANPFPHARMTEGQPTSLQFETQSAAGYHGKRMLLQEETPGDK